MRDLTLQQKQQLSDRNIGVEQLDLQIEMFKKGTKYLNLLKPATLSDGIMQLDKEALDYYIDLYDALSGNKEVCKFVPASGAATRMFKDLYTYLDSQEETPFITHFISNIEKFAFFEDLKAELQLEGLDIDDLIKDKNYTPIIRTLLDKEGLSYGSLPKGLLAFHKESDKIMTPVDEHIKEAKAYLGKQPELVFTISEVYQSSFEQMVLEAVEKEELTDAKYALTYQKPVTDTIAVDKQFNPVVMEDGGFLFRPGGHGSLIVNLNEIDADLIFIKNIDNVVTSKYLETTVKYKKALAGILLEVQAKVFELRERIENYDGREEATNLKIQTFIEQYLGLHPKQTESMNAQDKVAYFRDVLDRPIRVCGMVKNEGEPGGGPFWVSDDYKDVSLQIVESSQMDLSNKEQSCMLEEASHFNPVDLVCGVRNRYGQKYNLEDFIDKEAVFIAEKSFFGKEILALEHPGLWNGAMARWNTIFVEVPVETFNPVKTVNDLLKSTHQL